MKRNLTSALFLILGISLNAQVVHQSDIQKIKNSKLLVTLTEDEQFNEMLKATVAKYWTFSEVIGYESAENAIKRAKEDENILIMEVGSRSSKSMVHHSAGSSVGYQTISYGKAINIKKGKSTYLFSNYIPSFEGDVITEEVLIYGISTFQFMCKVMDEKNLASNMNLTKALKEYTPELKNKTLYLAEGWIDKKFDIQEIPDLYEGKIKVVSYDDWRNAIILGEEGIAYCMVVPVPVGGSYSYVHYLVDAKTATIYAMTYPKMAVNVAGFNVSKSNTGYINAKNISMYNDALNGKW
jgi:hypothetical protein